MVLEFRILGDVEVLRHAAPVDVGGRRQRAVLAVLLLRANQLVSCDQLVDDVWGGYPPAGVKGTLQAYVCKLRRTLEQDRPAGSRHGVLVSESCGYLLRVEAEQVDAFRFESLAEAGRGALVGGDPERAVELLSTALSLWRGRALADFASEAFAAPHAVRLEELRLAVIEDHIEARLALGRHRSVLGELEDVIRAHPLRERLWGQLMVAYYRAGCRPDALRAFDEACSVLGERLGIEPSPAVTALQRAIVGRDPILDWRPSRPSAPARSHAERQAGSPPFVGREDELALVHFRLADALAGRGRLILLTGDSGIGKTRFLEEIAGTARSADAEVTCHRSHHCEAAPALSSWIDVVRQLAARIHPLELKTALGFGAAEIARIVPELSELVSQEEPAITPRRDSGQFQLYDAMVRFFARLAARRPLVILLDDVHLADVASLDLLGFLAPEVPTLPILVAATYHVEVQATHPVVGILAKLGYEPAVTRLTLPAFGIAEVSRLLTESAGVEPSPALVAALHQRTEGDPLFLGTLVRMLQGQDRLSPSAAQAAAVPHEVRAVVAKRLAALPRTTLRLLELAAVAGRDFDLELLAATDGLAPERALQRLEAAFSSRLLTADAPVPGRYRFSQALVREVLYSGLSLRRRTSLHGRVAKAFEGLHRSGEDPRLGPLADFLPAVSPGSCDAAVPYVVRTAAPVA